MAIGGNGIQVLLNWSPEELAFVQTPIGQTSTMDVVFENVGQGDAVIEIEDPDNAAFSVEFVDTYEAPEITPCFELNEV